MNFLIQEFMSLYLVGWVYLQFSPILLKILMLNKNKIFFDPSCPKVPFFAFFSLKKNCAHLKLKHLILESNLRSTWICFESSNLRFCESFVFYVSRFKYSSVPFLVLSLTVNVCHTIPY